MRCVLFAIVAILLVRSAPAAACPPRLPADAVEHVTMARDGVMSIGLDRRERAVIYAIDVVTADGAPVGGTLERIGNRLVWRPQQALDPGVAYRATLSHVRLDGLLGRQVDAEFGVTVVDAETPPLVEPPQVEIVEAAEGESVTSEVCCDRVEGPGPNCGGGRPSYRHCWVQSLAYPVRATVRWARVPEDRRGAIAYTVIPPVGGSVDEDGIFAEPFSPPGTLQSVVVFPARAARLCVEIEARDLVHGTILLGQACTADVKPPYSRSVIRAPDIGVCEGDIVDPATGAVVVAKEPEDRGDDARGDDDGDGCSAGGQGQATTALAFAILCLVRRRR